jgi:hypothetical protein
LQRFWRSALLFGSALSLLFFQNCSRVSFSKLPPEANGLATESLRSDGGEVYDGKVIVLHHYEEGFQCQGRPQPESILLRYKEGDWRIIQNKLLQCANVDQLPVSGVVYDPISNQAEYGGRTYVPPRSYIVDATEDPNLPDIKLIDGICENINGKCSLLASVQNAGFAADTAAIKVIVPAGTYLMNKEMLLTTKLLAHEISIEGAGPLTTFLDGQGLTALLALRGGGNSVKFSHLTFQNATSQTGSGAAIGVQSFTGDLEVDDCNFRGNGGDSSIRSVGGGKIKVRRSKFINNTSIFFDLETFSTAGLTVEDSSFTGNRAMFGIKVQSISNVEIRNTTLSDNMQRAISFVECKSCLLENVTLYRNQLGGLSISTLFSGVAHDLSIKNSTLYENGKYSLQIDFQGINDKLVISNSVISTNSTSVANCTSTAGSGNNIVATNSLFDDTSCNIVSGSGNQFGSPLLGPLADNGGVTATLLPLPGSPLIDSGNNLSCSASDQRGFARPVDKLGAGARCDIGSVELQ